MTPAIPPIRSTGGGAVRFGIFEFDPETKELWRAGQPVRLQEQPARILAALLRSPGRIVSREELQREVWPSDTFVEFETGLNSAVRKLRRALGDSADVPIFIETIPRQGYRFIAPLDTDSHATAPPPRATAPRGRLAVSPWHIAAVAILLLVGAAAAWWIMPQLLRVNRRGAGQVTRLSLDLPPDQRIAEGNGLKVAIDPQGRWIAYVATVRGTSMIFQRPLAENATRALPGTEGATCVMASRDGKWLIYATRDTVREMSLDGREVREVARPWRGMLTTASGPDDTLYFPAPSEAADPNVPVSVWVADPQRRTFRSVTKHATSSSLPEYHFPQDALPSGRHLLFGVVASPFLRSIAAVDLRDGSQRVLLDQAMEGRYLPTGHLLYHWGDTLYATEFDPDTLEVKGRGSAVLEHVTRWQWTGAQAAYSDTGTLVYLAEPPPEPRELVWVSHDGRETKIPAPPGEYVPLDVAADGSAILVGLRDAVDQWTLWSYRPSVQSWTKVADELTNDLTAVFSPDATRIATVGNAGDHSNFGMTILNAAAPSASREFIAATYGTHPQQWSAARNGIVVTANPDALRSLDVELVSPGSAPKFKPLEASRELECHGAISPDGKLLAYTFRDGAIWRVMVRPVDGGKAVRVSGDDGGAAPLWSRDGRTLYYRASQKIYSAALIQPGGEPRFAPPRLLVAGHYTTPTGWSRRYCLSPDGRSFLLAKPLPRPEFTHKLEVIINWFDEVERLAGKVRRR